MSTLLQDDLVSSFKERFETEISSSIAEFGDKSQLRDACEYALTSGGKRLRPILVYLINESLGSQHSVTPIALAVEYFHTASLIVDDLPCMDNDFYRRGKPSTHRVFDEGTALLASYSLIAKGFEKLHEAGRMLPVAKDHQDALIALAIKSVATLIGSQGLAQGQCLDLNEKNLDLETLKMIAELKTSRLFQLAFNLGWIFGLGNIDQLEKVDQASCHFGMAFQILDDLKDFNDDQETARLNLACFVGLDKAKETLDEEIKSCRLILDSLGLNRNLLSGIVDFIEDAGKIVTIALKNAK